MIHELSDWYKSYILHLTELIVTSITVFVEGYFITSRNLISSMNTNCIFHAATGVALWKKVFLKISQYSQEYTCAGVFY